MTLALLRDAPSSSRFGKEDYYSGSIRLQIVKTIATEYKDHLSRRTIPLSIVYPSWTGSGIVQNISPATSDGAAIWKILNPAGNTAMNTIELFPLPYPIGFEAPNPADFSLRAFNTTSV